MTCTSCGAENRAEARFCDSCGGPLAAAAVREQRKVVTVLFCDVSGSTALGESLDPEAVRAVMARYFEVARTAIERHGGTVEKFIGDAVMAVFGVPTVREDDALRAVRAAQELRDGVEIDVRIGVNTGEVVTGSGDSLVTGDAVNVAARLEQAAGTGDVLLGADTYALVRDAIDAELLPPLTAKGKSAPVTAYRLVAVTGDTPVARRADAPFVGRDRERALLSGAWNRAVSERACALFTILGAAGVGKSRLASEFLEGLDATVVRGRCLSYGEGITYWPVVEVVLQLLAGKAPPNPTIAALLGEGVASADDVALGVRKLFEAAAAERPLVVVLDDVQWGEPTFLDFVEHVSDWSRGAPILLLCLARPDLLDLRPAWGGGKLNATTVLLEPLTAAETDELIDALLEGRGLDAPLRERIRSASDGNPLFVEQMLAMIEETPDLVTVPASIQALLAARLDQLPPRERAALERGAVEGQVFHRGAVAALAPDDPDVGSRLLGLVRKELVRPSEATLPGDDAFRFRHLLIRDAAYEALPKSVRANLHAQFAAWLEAHAPDLVELDEIAGYHLEQAALYRRELGGDAAGEAAAAAARLAAAGLRAKTREDASASVSLLGRAVALLDGRSLERLALLPDLGEVLYDTGKTDAAYAALDEAMEHGDVDTSAQAFFFKTFAMGHTESISPIELERRLTERLAAIADVASDRTLARGEIALGWALFWAGRNRDAAEAAGRALERTRRSGDRTKEIQAMHLLGGAKHYGEATWEEVERHAAEMEALGVPPGPARAMGLAYRGEFDEARRLYQALDNDLRQRGSIVFALGQLSGLCIVEILAGNLERGEAVAREAWDGLGELGENGFRSTAGAELGAVLARLGRYDEAEAVLDEAIGLGTPDDWLTVSEVTMARALVASGRGRHAEAVELAAEAVALSDAHEYLTQRQEIWFTYATILRAADRPDEARAALERARELASRKGSTFLVARADELLASF